MRANALQAGLIGWRARLADRAAEPVARRTGLTAEQVRTLLAALFLAKSTIYLGRALVRATPSRRARNQRRRS